MCIFLREQVFDERGLGQVQAIWAPEGGSSGAEPTVAMIFSPTTFVMYSQAEWLRMLDGSLENPFFARNADGSLVHPHGGLGEGRRLHLEPTKHRLKPLAL